MFFIIVVNKIFGNFWSFSHYLYPTIWSLVFHFFTASKGTSGVRISFWWTTDSSANITGTRVTTVLRIRVILVRIRIWIFSLVAFKTPTNNFKFFFLMGTFTLFFKDKKSKRCQKNLEIKVFRIVFAWWKKDPDQDPYLWLTGLFRSIGFHLWQYTDFHWGSRLRL